ncbi:MAG: molybdate ABC transporter substrate-binding protein [Bacteroidales bacterium OttesenSCG-928-I14]|jgi:molybdate transport system substrate-binding protein|nr:molybdate ABC transporter substrate-binding protein [Bacteroidales bacterium OttesenSCG-928-I14]
MRRIIFLFIFSHFFISVCAQTIVKVAAAANLSYVLKEIKKQYELEYPHSKINITFGPSGLFTNQILNGADFDFFMAADMVYPEKIVSSGYANGKVDIYAYGKLALWSLNLDVSNGLRSLFLPQVKKIAIANPKTAPYGRSAVRLLKNNGVYDKINNKIVWGDDISQTAQFAFSGNAELAFIALSFAFSPEMQNNGHFYVFPEDVCPQQKQGCVLIKKSKSKKEAERFKNYVMGHKCDGLWIKFGYGLAKKQ